MPLQSQVSAVVYCKQRQGLSGYFPRCMHHGGKCRLLCMCKHKGKFMHWEVMNRNVHQQSQDCKQLKTKMWVFHFTLHFPALNKKAEGGSARPAFNSLPSAFFTVRQPASRLSDCGRANLTKWKQWPPLVSCSRAGENSSLIVALLLTVASQLHYP